MAKTQDTTSDDSDNRQDENAAGRPQGAHWALINDPELGAIAKVCTCQEHDGDHDDAGSDLAASAVMTQREGD